MDLIITSNPQKQSFVIFQWSEYQTAPVEKWFSSVIIDEHILSHEYKTCMKKTKQMTADCIHSCSSCLLFRNESQWNVNFSVTTPLRWGHIRDIFSVVKTVFCSSAW